MSGGGEVKRVHATIGVLAERWPKAFSVFQQRRPLKIGIHAEIAAAAPDIEPSLVDQTVGYYCRSIGYLNACTVGAARVDLDGNACGEVSAGDAAHAAAKFATALRRRAAKRQAEPSSPPISTKSPSPCRGDGLAALKAAALARKAAQA
jgi:ProP effector